MALNTVIRKIVYDGNGGPFPYAIPFKFFENQHIKVILRAPTGEEFDKALGADYVVTGSRNPSGGELRLLENLGTDWQILIFRSVAPYLQQTLFTENGQFPALSFEDALDLIHMALQELADGLGHTFSVSLFETITNTQDLTLLTREISSVLGTDSSGNLTWIPRSDFTGSGGGVDPDGWRWKRKIGDKAENEDHARNQLVNYGPFKKGDIVVVDAFTDETIRMRDASQRILELPGRALLVCYSNTGGSYWSNFYPFLPWKDNMRFPQAPFINTVTNPDLPNPPVPIPDIVIPGFYPCNIIPGPVGPIA